MDVDVPNVILIGERKSDKLECDTTMLQNGRKISIPNISLADGNVLCCVAEICLFGAWLMMPGQ
jgi:hypothetical protein